MKHVTTIRFRITVWFIIVILIANASLSFVTVAHIGRITIQEVQTRVRFNLNSARGVYQYNMDRIATLLQGAAIRFSPVQTPDGEVDPLLKEVLRNLLQENQLDILTVMDSSGTVLYRAHNPDVFGDNLHSNIIVSQAIEQGRASRGTMILTEEQLLREHPKLAARARIEVQSTPSARSLSEPIQTCGMAIAAAVPFVTLSHGEERQGVLYAANLLNRRYEIVDQIKKELFEQEEYDTKGTGTATLFQNDLRISTNVLTSHGARAVGTQMSAEVHDEVLLKGELWSKRAFVVNNWYIAAYEPIRNPTNQIIGALYVGLLEEPFTRPMKLLTAVFVGMVVLTTLLSLVLLSLVIRHLLSPINTIMTMSSRVIEGDLSARVGIRPPGEMGLLCETIDKMADAVSLREERLQNATREQIGQSEKLAAIGRLAAGIAHEVNNPLTAVLTFAHLLRESPKADEEQKQDLEVIVRETTRVREIVRGLLDFARESPSRRQILDINEILQKTLRLLKSQKDFGRITIDLQLQDKLPPVMGDRNQIQQVFLNLALNACEAMPEAGTLTVKTVHEGTTVRVDFSDTGCGIPEDHLTQIFDPFFTTKPVGKGTGLGLSVTYGIIQQHEGQLLVHSTVHEGSTFSVVFQVCTDPVYLIEDDSETEGTPTQG